jgi:hypothetical protein
MIDEAEQWERHQKSRYHRRQASKLGRAIGEQGSAAHELMAKAKHTSSSA